MRQLHFSSAVGKIRKGEKKNKASVHIGFEDADNELVKGALKEMNELEAILEDELAKHFSLQLDIRQYEQIVVKLDDTGEELMMNRIGRVSLKSPQLLAINFVDNPAAIKAAKLALLNSNLGVNPQQEGTTLFIPIPRMTRERRELLAKTAKAKLFNDYKVALNEVYTKYDKKTAKQLAKNPDEAAHVRSTLLSMKRAKEMKGLENIEARRAALLKELA